MSAKGPAPADRTGAPGTRFPGGWATWRGRRCCCRCRGGTSTPARGRLRVAERQPEPERAVQLEVVALPGRRRVHRGRALGMREAVLHVVPRPGGVRVIDERGFVVADVLVVPVHLRVVGEVRTEPAVFAVD